MFGSVNHFDPFDDSACLVWRKRFVKRAQAVCVEVVHYERDPLCLRPMDIDQFSNLVSPIDSRSLVRHCDVPPAGQRFGEGKDIRGAIPFVFAIKAFDSSWLGLQRRLFFDG